MYIIFGQSYKHFTLVKYDFKVVIWDIFQSGTTIVLIYDRRMMIRLATGWPRIGRKSGFHIWL